MSDDFPLHGHAEHRGSIPVVEALSDDELRELNQMLRWNCFVADSRGRRFGQPTSATKRNLPQPVPDPRIAMLHKRLDLSDKVVLEVGCFEGVHTAGLCRVAKSVKACDSRISNIVKTAVRCAMYQVHPQLFLWNVEKPIPEYQDAGCDVLHHVGVLYHLADPIAHLQAILPLVRVGLMLDTHYADEGSARDRFTRSGQSYRCKTHRESGYADPFSGMNPASRWLLLDDLVDVLKSLGLSQVEIVERRAERNGPRVLLLARR